MLNERFKCASFIIILILIKYLKISQTIPHNE
jgi:hypothetical protein